MERNNSNSPTLEELLAEAKVKELNTWAEHLDISFPLKFSKVERVKALAQLIRKSPQNVVKYLPCYNLQLFLDAINGKLSTEEFDFYVEYVQFHNYGLVYAIESNNYVPVFQPDLVDVYKPVIEAEIERRRANGIYKFEQYVIGYANTFGIMLSEDFVIQCEKVLFNAEVEVAARVYDIENALSLLCRITDDNFYYCSPFIFEHAEIHNLGQMVHYDDDFIYGMGTMPWLKFDKPSAKQLVSLMESFGIEQKDIQKVMMVSWLGALADKPLKIVNYIRTQLALDWDCIEQIERATLDFLHDVPIWRFLGYSVNETKIIAAKKAQESPITIGPDSTPMIIGKKPGRNDPCPCGSGKKYKHCCGR
ncbi:MAG: YecA family protein [Muribaculaceae bacterium]